MITTMDVYDTKTEEDAKKIFDNIKEAIENDMTLILYFKKEVSWEFATALLKELYIDVNLLAKARNWIRFRGFRKLSKNSLDNMKLAKVREQHSYNNIYEEYL